MYQYNCMASLFRVHAPVMQIWSLVWGGNWWRWWHAQFHFISSGAKKDPLVKQKKSTTPHKNLYIVWVCSQMMDEYGWIKITRKTESQREWNSQPIKDDLHQISSFYYLYDLVQPCIWRTDWYEHFFVHCCICCSHEGYTDDLFGWSHSFFWSYSLCWTHVYFICWIHSNFEHPK